MHVDGNMQARPDLTDAAAAMTERRAPREMGDITEAEIDISSFALNL